MAKPFFSIIIPVYNSEKYLSECLDSIKNQSFTDYEVILVDDGSSDGSLSICKAYSSEDSRFITIYQENAGTSAARNTGIRNANGSYITFIDNDDCWVSSAALRSLFDILNESRADLVAFQSFVFSGAVPNAPLVENTSLSQYVDSLSYADALKILTSKGYLCSAVWTKACSSKIVKPSNGDWIIFPEGMRNEDTYWTGKVIQRAKSIAWCDNPFYAYRKGHEYAQTSKPLSLQQVDDLTSVCLELASDINVLDLTEDVKIALRSFLAYPYSVWIGQSSIVHIHPSDADYKKMKSLLPVLACSDNPSVVLVRRIVKVFGFNIARHLCALFLRLKYRNIAG